MPQLPEMPPEMELLYGNMTNRIGETERTDGLNPFQRIERCALIVIDAVKELRKQVLKVLFAGKTEEIHFFKTVKPQFYSRLIYYLELYQVEINHPPGSKDSQEKYLNGEINKLNYFFDNNRDFYRYYRSGATHLDEIYFLGGGQPHIISVDPFYFDTDTRFSSSHDYILSKLMAYEMIGAYVNNELDEITASKTSSRISSANNSPMTWTAPKAGLIELIYACQSYGAFNNGEADIRQISDYLQRMFNVNLGNLYRTFQEIRIRKKGRSYFLDQLREKLIERMDHSDENPR